ncbi:uncharacterized protein TNCV_1360501 [Trichonephila clavipes]|nr:uncharacterized protein TNCV_1360501 [Trichonephila clavipes]
MYPVDSFTCGCAWTEAADEMAGRGCGHLNPSCTVLTHTEIHSFQLTKMNLTWRNPPAHHWYAAKSPGISIQCRSSRTHQTVLKCFRKGHLRNMTFVQGVKYFLPVPALSLFPLITFWGLSLRQLYGEQGLVYETFTRKDQMDLM